MLVGGVIVSIVIFERFAVLRSAFRPLVSWVWPAGTFHVVDTRPAPPSDFRRDLVFVGVQPDTENRMAFSVANGGKRLLGCLRTHDQVEFFYTARRRWWTTELGRRTEGREERHPSGFGFRCDMLVGGYGRTSDGDE